MFGQRRFLCITLALGALASSLYAADAGPKPAPTFNEEPVFRFISSQERKTLTMSSPSGSMTVNEPNVLLTVAAAGGGSAQSLVLITKAEETAAMVKALKPGDYLTLTTEPKFNISYIKTIAQYDLQPGEDLPNAFVFAGMGDSDTAGQALKVYKLGKLGKALVPADKTALLTLAARLKEGDVIEAAGTPSKGALVLSELWIYCPPVTGTVAGVADQTVGETKTTALQLTVGDETKTLCVPGKTDSKGHFTPDARLLAAIKGLKTGDTVQAAFHSDGETLWLKAVAATHAAAHSTTK
jgi:hypothetical protein